MKTKHYMDRNMGNLQKQTFIVKLGGAGRFGGATEA
jgi:hypothetical protein